MPNHRSGQFEHKVSATLQGISKSMQTTIVQAGKEVKCDNQTAQNITVNALTGAVGATVRSAERGINLISGVTRLSVGLFKGLKHNDWRQAHIGGEVLKREMTATAKGVIKAGGTLVKYGGQATAGVVQAGYGHYTGSDTAKNKGLARLKSSVPVIIAAVAAGLLAGEVVDALAIDDDGQYLSVSDSLALPNWHQVSWDDLDRMELFHTPIDTGHGFVPYIDPDTIPGVIQGVATEDAIPYISKLGEVDNSVHITDVTRSQGVINAFLAEHGFNKVPDGYEVHHIIPLSENGADDPANLIIVSEELHQRITNQHARFYNWDMWS